MSSSDQIVSHLRSRIIAGALRHGSIIQPANGVEFYETSRNTFVGALKTLNHAGYVSFDARGRSRAFSWNAVQIGDQYRLGGAMLEIAAEALTTRASDQTRNVLANRLLVVGIDASDDVETLDTTLVEVAHSFSAIAVACPVNEIASATAKLFPFAARRIALANMEPRDIMTIAGMVRQMGSALASSNFRELQSAITTSLGLMQRQIVDRSKFLEAYVADPVADLNNLPEIPGSIQPVIAMRPDSFNYETWVSDVRSGSQAVSA